MTTLFKPKAPAPVTRVVQPAPAPEPPKRTEPKVQAAGVDELRRRKGRGRLSTILTTPTSRLLPQGAVSRKTLLGG